VARGAGNPVIDVAIVGAGPVGATLAARLGRHGLECAIFEARPGPAADARTLALSEASREGLDAIGGWPREGVTAITSIHVSQLGGPGRTVIEAREQGVAALGHTVGFAALERALHAAVASAGVPIHFGAACEQIDLGADAARLAVTGHGTVAARLLVLADGGANAARIPGVAFVEKDYGQQAVVGTVATDRPHAGRAWERFTPGGPMALLPVGERYALVWTARAEQVARLRELDDAAFVSRLQERFGDRAGRFGATGPRASFPLKLRVVNTPVALRTAIVGNAAQALHPIAGQGLNLGLRDAHQLADTITVAQPEVLGSAAMLDAYRAARRRDTRRGVAFTDLLVSAFASDWPLPRWGRGLALAALDVFPPARRLLAERMIHGAPGS
jgi:2-octaprenyl-6-methoxyphenol hydroxylase